jgi:hypothetical protein
VWVLPIKRAVIQQNLHHRGGAAFNAGERQHMRIAAAGGIARNIKQIFDGKGHPLSGPLRAWGPAAAGKA